MTEITPMDIKMWSRLGPRATYGIALSELIEEDERILALSADLGQSSGLLRLMTTKPERYVNVGIAEQNLIGVAAGMTKAGFIPFASSFAPFITLRCADQIRMNLGYMNLNVKLVGLGSGCSMGYLGYSHYGMEDIALLRAIPNLTILSPADCGQIVGMVRLAAEHDGPVYIRLTGEPGMPTAYAEKFDVEIGGANILREGCDIAFIATGSMVIEAVKAAEQLEEQGFRCSVADMYSIKPLNMDVLDAVSQDVKLLVTVEEHSVIGGLGSAVAEYISSKKHVVPILRLGMPDEYLKAGSYTYMKEQYGLTADKIAMRVAQKLE